MSCWGFGVGDGSSAVLRESWKLWNSSRLPSELQGLTVVLKLTFSDALYCHTYIKETLLKEDVGLMKSYWNGLTRVWGSI
ncbi:uncharacterized [Tachysurus ichikawai]